MDRNLSKNPEVQRLIRIGDSARSCLKNEVSTLQDRLDFPARIRDSLKSHPTGWLLGSLGSGLAASLLFRRKPSAAATAETKHRGLFASLLGLALTAARPLLKAWLTSQATGYLAGRSGAIPASRHPNRSPF
ncbi:MAG TPA: hypothetical protein VF258_03165 [Luteolibacter sp.]